MIYSLIIYLAFIFPISIKKYKIDGKDKLIFKIFNTLITLYVFVYLGGNVKQFFYAIKGNPLFFTETTPRWIYLGYFVIYGAVSFFTIVQMIRLAIRKEGARLQFLIVIPILWILTGIEKYYAYIIIYSETPSRLYAIVSNLWYAFIWGGFFLFYKSRRTKEFLSISKPE